MRRGTIECSKAAGAARCVRPHVTAPHQNVPQLPPRGRSIVYCHTQWPPGPSTGSPGKQLEAALLHPPQHAACSPPHPTRPLYLPLTGSEDLLDVGRARGGVAPQLGEQSSCDDAHVCCYTWVSIGFGKKEGERQGSGGFAWGAHGSRQLQRHSRRNGAVSRVIREQVGSSWDCSCDRLRASRLLCRGAVVCTYACWAGCFGWQQTVHVFSVTPPTPRLKAHSTLDTRMNLHQINLKGGELSCSNAGMAAATLIAYGSQERLKWLVLKEVVFLKASQLPRCHPSSSHQLAAGLGCRLVLCAAR